MKTCLLLLLLPTCLFAQKATLESSQPLKLWYDKPATYFEETLLIGNGQQGATIFGGTTTDKIYLNDITLWSGEPVNANMNPEAYKHLPAVRSAIASQHYKAADSLIKKLQGKFSESYAPLGTLLINFDSIAPTNKYHRALSIDSAIATSSYQQGSNTITKTYLYSHPDKILAIRIKSANAGGLHFSVKFESLLKYVTKTSKNTLAAFGVAPVKADPSYLAKAADAIVFDTSRGTRFSAQIKIVSSTGKLVQTDSTIGVQNANEATIYVSLATSFNGFDKDPVKQGLNSNAIATTQLNNAVKKSFEQIKLAHVKDYQHFFNRVKLHLNNDSFVDIPTDVRLKRYATVVTDPYLETLYFQYGRYLLISSSRTKAVPANLQGLWNHYLQPPWSSNYTMNINAEENYWLAENTNLSEMHLPFLQFINNLSKTGSVTAKTFYNLPGWVVHHNSDIWAMSNPVGNFGKGDPSWANWTMGGTWASTHLWEHYLFTSDTVFLKQHAYPLMKGAAEFCLGFLIKDSAGHLVTSPSTSPENYYKNFSGYQGATLFGGTADLAMIRELFLDIMSAQKVLKNDLVFADKIKVALDNLHPYQVGKVGNLQEWYYDWSDVDPKHRHQSHLYGLFPGNHVTVNNTPLIAAAAKRTLEIKGDETTGWSKGWRINLWARLKDGDHAYKMYRELLKYVAPDGAKENYARGGGTYPNLLDAHPPFQIDGNFGGAAAVAEMLVQSNSDYIELLPALPKSWPKGSVSGLKARGNYEIDMDWQHGLVTRLKIKSSSNKKANVFMNGKMMVIETTR